MKTYMVFMQTAKEYRRNETCGCDPWKSSIITTEAHVPDEKFLITMTRTNKAVKVVECGTHKEIFNNWKEISKN